MHFFSHCQDLAGKMYELIECEVEPQGSSQVWIQMAPVAEWDPIAVLFPSDFRPGDSLANAQSAPQKFNNSYW